MRTTWLALGSLLAVACATGDAGPTGTDASGDDATAVDVVHGDIGAMDTARIDVAARDTATTDSVSQQDVASMPDTSRPDVLATPDVARLMCPATCATNDNCAASCPAATSGTWCCLASTCVDRASCGTVMPDAGSSCTGTLQCDATHHCAIPGTRCCSPLPGLSGCGFCSPGACPG